MQHVSIAINGTTIESDIDERTLLVEFIRDFGGFTGTHAGCYEARCGCCTVQLDDGVVKACNVLAVQADGRNITTVEGLAEPPKSEGSGIAPALTGIQPDHLTALQSSFRDNGAVQCGFCTPGMLMLLSNFLQQQPDPAEADVREAIRGTLCRCTGYQKIIDATLDAAKKVRSE